MISPKLANDVETCHNSGFGPPYHEVALRFRFGALETVVIDQPILKLKSISPGRTLLDKFPHSVTATGMILGLDSSRLIFSLDEEGLRIESSETSKTISVSFAVSQEMLVPRPMGCVGWTT